MSDESPYVTVAEFATHFRISKMSVFRMVHAGDIKAVRIGRTFRIPKTEIERFDNEGI